MKTKFVLALMATSSLLAACGSFNSSIGPGQLTFPLSNLSTDKALPVLDGVLFNKIKNPEVAPKIQHLELKLSGKKAPFSYWIKMSAEETPEQSQVGESVVLDNTGDQKVIMILNDSVNVTLKDDANCVKIDIPNQNQNEFFKGLKTGNDPIELCK